VKGLRGALIALGAVIMTYAVLGALGDADVGPGVLIFLAGVLVAHDGVLVPLTIAVGALTGRFVPRRLRPVVRGALIACVAVTVVGLPLVLSNGRAADNPSLLPRDYGRALLELYALIWATALAALAATTLRRYHFRGGKLRLAGRRQEAGRGNVVR
jgi:hypothetical protein